MDQELQIKLLISNIKKLENLVDDLIDNLDSKRKKVEYLKEKIAFNIKEIDKIIQKYNHRPNHLTNFLCSKQ